MKGKRALIAQYGIGLLLIVVLLLLGDISDLRSLLEANMALLMLAFLCTATAALISSHRWGLIVRELTWPRVYPKGFFLRYVLLGQALTFLVPQDLGAMGAKTASLRVMAGVPTTTSVYSVLLDRMLDLLVMAALSLPAVLFLGRVIGFEAATGLALFQLGLLLGSHLLPERLTPVRISAVLYTVILRLVGLVPGVARRLPSAEIGSQGYELSRSTSFRLTAYTILRFLLFVIRAYIIGAALGSQIPFSVFFLGMPLAQLSLVLAITPAGLGITELGWYAVLSAAGIPQPDVLLFIVGSRAFNVFSVLVLALFANFAIGSSREPEE